MFVWLLSVSQSWEAENTVGDYAQTFQPISVTLAMYIGTIGLYYLTPLSVPFSVKLSWRLQGKQNLRLFLSDLFLDSIGLICKKAQASAPVLSPNSSSIWMEFGMLLTFADSMNLIPILCRPIDSQGRIFLRWSFSFKLDTMMDTAERYASIPV